MKTSTLDHKNFDKVTATQALPTIKHDRYLGHCNGDEVFFWNLDMEWAKKMSAYGSLSGMTLLPSILILFVSFFAKEKGEDAIYIYAVIFLMILIGIPLFLLYLKEKKRGPENSTLTFNRRTGNFSVTACGGNPAFSVPFSSVEFYATKMSVGRGVKTWQCFLAPKEYPDEVVKHKTYDIPIEVGSQEDAEYFWSALTTFMDQSQPIPPHFYASIQLAVDSINNKEIDTDVEVRQEFMDQAPYYNFKTQRADLEKELW